MKLTVCGEAVAAYLAHTVAGRTVRGIARAAGVEPSTITRRVRRVEDLRDNPEWDEILTALEAGFMARDPMAPITVEAVFMALDVTKEDLRGAVRRLLPSVKLPLSFIATSTGVDKCMSPAPDGPPNIFIPRRVLLAGLAVGWFRLQAGGEKVRKYEVAPPARAVFPAAPAALVTGAPAVVAMAARKHPDLFTDYRQRVAVAVQVAALCGDAAKLEAALPGTINATLAHVCAHDRGLVELEAEMGWPARSGKLALALALDVAGPVLGVRP